MRCRPEMMRLYAVTDRAWTKKKSLIEQVEEAICGGKKKSLIEQVEEAICGGATCIQLREKNLDEEAFLREAIEMQKLCETYQVPLIINDHVEIAKQCKAAGVHLGQKDMEAGRARGILGPKMILGVSARTVEQAVQAERAGADYLGVGAVFQTSTKTDAKEISHAILKEICESVNIPVVAIGGIGKQNIEALAGSGIAGVALVSVVFAAEDIEQECRGLLKQIERISGTIKTNRKNRVR